MLLYSSLRDSEASHNRGEDIEEHSAGEIIEEAVLRRVTFPKFDPAEVTEKQYFSLSSPVLELIIIIIIIIF